MPPPDPQHALAESATVSGAMAAAFFDFASARGADLGDREFTIAGEADDRVPLERFREMQRQASRLASDPLLALRFAAESDPADYSIVGLLLKLATTVVEAAACFGDFGRLLVDAGPQTGGYRPEPRGADLWIVDQGAEDALAELTFAHLISGTRRSGFGPWPTRLHLRRPVPPGAAHYQAILGVPVIFESRCNALVGDAARMTAPVRRGQPSLRNVLADHARLMLRALDLSGTTSARVEKLLVARLPTGTAAAGQIAAACGIDRRTLHRRLRQEGTTYVNLLASVRRRLAIYLLGVKRMPVNRVAYDLGFSDPAAFSRAFKRWTGLNPSDAAKLPLDGAASAHWADVSPCGIPSGWSAPTSGC
jgi:AraC-like DNA-binding protein